MKLQLKKQNRGQQVTNTDKTIRQTAGTRVYVGFNTVKSSPHQQHLQPPHESTRPRSSALGVGFNLFCAVPYIISHLAAWAPSIHGVFLARCIRKTSSIIRDVSHLHTERAHSHFSVFSNLYSKQAFIPALHPHGYILCLPFLFHYHPDFHVYSSLSLATDSPSAHRRAAEWWSLV